MPGPGSGVTPIRDGPEFGGIAHAVDATFIPQALERSDAILLDVFPDAGAVDEALCALAPMLRRVNASL